jgi:hypothetical protein
MYIGLGIVLLVVGAILSFDVITVNIPHVNADALGAILMVGGALAILLSFGRPSWTTGESDSVGLAGRVSTSERCRPPDIRRGSRR